MADQNKPSYRFDDLSFIGKAVFLTGATVRAVGNVLDYAIEKTVDIAVETEKAFREGKDGRIEDARILEEYSPSDAEKEHLE